ncbi:MAG: hypothetical protein JWM11_1677, partial [Planctomycetaceae bacterium]|nr:hypothetical protein [Planctomycetaceae bacterium]
MTLLESYNNRTNDPRLAIAVGNCQFR